MTVPDNFLIINNCSLYHGQRKSARKDNWKDIRMSFQLVNDSLFNDKHFEDNATNHPCKSSCTTFSEQNQR